MVVFTSKSLSFATAILCRSSSRFLEPFIATGAGGTAWSRRSFPRPRSHSSVVSRSIGTRLSPNEVTFVLRAHEHTEEINYGSVKSFDTNQLPSNSPIEDMRAEAKCLLTTGLLFGVIDGHGGPSCAQVVAKRLFNYIAASLLPPDVLHKLLNPNTESSFPLLETFNDMYDLVPDLEKLYQTSYRKYLDDLLLQDETGEFNMSKALQRAFTHLDDDIQREARLLAHKEGKETSESEPSGSRRPKDTESLFRKTLSVAESGAVTVVVHVDGEHLHVASIGDCRVILGTRPGDDVTEGSSSWIAQSLNKEHNAENIDEIHRLQSEHPETEKDTIVRNERLLGQLAPFRAFGDVQFKWTKEEIRELLVPYMGEQAVINYSLTPPYLTAKPEITYHRLRPKDSFMIIASDGLWDMLTPSQAVQLVGEHMSGKTILSPYKLPTKRKGIKTAGSLEDGVRLSVIHETLMKRLESIKLKPIDSNAATHLVRHALGGTDAGLDNNRLSYYLTLPEDTVRFFRDDITVTVVFFDSEFLSQRPLVSSDATGTNDHSSEEPPPATS